MIEGTARQSAFRAAAESAFVTELAALTAIRIDGEDAREFLQNQLSSDVYALSAGNAEAPTLDGHLLDLQEIFGVVDEVADTLRKKIARPDS